MLGNKDFEDHLIFHLFFFILGKDSSWVMLVIFTLRFNSFTFNFVFEVVDLHKKTIMNYDSMGGKNDEA